MFKILSHVDLYRTSPLVLSNSPQTLLRRPSQLQYQQTCLELLTQQLSQLLLLHQLEERFAVLIEIRVIRCATLVPGVIRIQRTAAIVEACSYLFPLKELVAVAGEVMIAVAMIR